MIRSVLLAKIHVIVYLGVAAEIYCEEDIGGTWESKTPSLCDAVQILDPSGLKLVMFPRAYPELYLGVLFPPGLLTFDLRI